MPDMEKVINGLCDAIGIIHGHVPKRYWGYGEQACRDAIELLKEQPEIVRCKDCRNGVKSPTFRYYPKITWCNKHSASHNDDWFCADEERKEGR